MYQQIMANIEQLILSHAWSAGMALPSIRELAVALNVSVITVKRAYQELEKEQLIITRHGKGSFVADRVDSAASSKHQQMQDHLKQAVDIAHMLNVEKDNLKKDIDALYEQSSSKGTSA